MIFRRSTFFVSIILFAFFVGAQINVVPNATKANYLILVICFFAFLTKRELVKDRVLLLFPVIFFPIVIGFFEYPSLAIKHALLSMLALIPFIFIRFTFDLKECKLFLYAYVVSALFFLIFVPFTNQEFRTDSIFENAILSPVSSFVFVFLISQRDKLFDSRMLLLVFLVLTFVIMFLTNKRIAILSTIVGVSLLFYPRKKFGNERYLVTLLPFITFFILYLFANGTFDSFIFEKFHQSPNEFSQGRYYIFWDFYRIYFSVADFHNVLIGNGLGFTEDFMLHSDYVPDNINLLHSDHLKMISEYGVIGTLFYYIIFMYRVKTKLSYSLFVMLLVQFTTDNILIYPAVVFTFYYFYKYSEVNYAK